MFIVALVYIKAHNGRVTEPSRVNNMTISRFLPVVLLLVLPLAAFAEGDENEWNTALKNQYFAGKTITESNDVIELEAPYRAEDPALVPLKIVSKIPQTTGQLYQKNPGAGR